MKQTAEHILPTASNLLGFAFLVLASIKGFGIPHTFFIDGLLALLIFTLAGSVLLSFVSIRHKNQDSSRTFETVADYLFIISLGMIMVLSILLIFDIFFIIQ